MDSRLDDASLSDLARAVANRLTVGGQRLAVAESCTGGWVAKLCTDLAGSSQWFECGLVTYSNEAKVKFLDVAEATLTVSGAVSEPVAAQMALGAVMRSGADYALAITGIAGPGGGSPEKPVGTVCFGWVIGPDRVETEQHWFQGNRDQVRRASVYQALAGLLQRL